MKPLCNKCNSRPVVAMGKGKFRKICWLCKKPNNYSKHRKDKCDFCGFIPSHICQLDVDHIDGNHQNNSTDNLQTLCANCHRLKTYIQLHNPNYCPPR